MQKTRKITKDHLCFAHHNRKTDTIVTVNVSSTSLASKGWQKRPNGEINLTLLLRCFQNDTGKLTIGKLKLLAVAWGVERLPFSKDEGKTNSNFTKH